MKHTKKINKIGGQPVQWPTAFVQTLSAVVLGKTFDLKCLRLSILSPKFTMKRKDSKMNTQLDKYMIFAQNSTLTQTNTAIINGISVLANTYAKAKDQPSKYAKFGYDFPEMIKTKVIKLRGLNSNDPWVITLSDSLLKSLDSPDEIIDICMPYVK